MATYIYDPSEKTTGINPLDDGWADLLGFTGSVTTSEIQLVTTPVGTKAWVYQFSNSGFKRARWDTGGPPAETTDVQVLSLWRTANTNIAQGNIHRIDGGTSYYWGLRNSATEVVGKRFTAAGTDVTIDTVTHGFTRATDKWYWVKSQTIGTAHKVKAWEYNTVEPDWQIEQTEATLASGRVGFGDWHGASNVKSELAWYSVGTGGDAAPLPGASIDPPVASGTFAPPAGTVNSAYSYATAGLFTGGTPTSYAVATGTLPAGVTLNTSTGLLSGTPTTAGTATGVSITATNADGSATTNTASIVVNAQLFTRTIEISNITVANGEDVTLTLTNPSGFSITPLSKSVVVYRKTSPVASGTFAPPQGNVDSSYSYATSSLFTGGEPTSYALATGTLPTGLSLNTTTGVISGTPTTEQTATGLSITGTNANGSATTNTASIVIDAAVNDLYYRAWHDEIEQLPQDANGWSIVEPSATSRVVYLSSTGDDSTAQIYGVNSFTNWRAPTAENAYATLDAAHAQLRAGEDDFLCIKYGTQINRTQALNLKHGKSYAARQVFCGYGDPANGRWKLNAVLPFANTNQVKLLQVVRSPNEMNQGNFIAIFDGHFTSHQRNPNHPDFGGYNHMKPGWGVDALFVYTATDKPRGMHFENCQIDWLKTGFNARNCEQFVERRNTFAWLFGGFAIGILNERRVKGLCEENVFYKCGYLDRYDGTVTSQGPTAGQFVGQLSGALTGAAVTSVEFTQTIPSNTPTGTLLYVTDNSSNLIECEVVSVSGSTATIIAKDFSSNNANSGNTARLELFGGHITNHSTYYAEPIKTISRNNVSISPSSLHIKNIQDENNTLFSIDNSRYGNVLIDGEVGIEASGNIASSSSPRFGNYDIRGNVITNINESRSTNRNLGWGILLRDHDGLLCTDNFIIKKGSPLNTIAVSIKLENFANNCEISDNTIDDYPAVDLDLQPNQQGIVVENNRVDEAGYVDSTRDIHTFMSSISETGGIQGFAELLYGRSPQNWVTLDRDYAAYIKAGFTKV